MTWLTVGGRAPFTVRKRNRGKQSHTVLIYYSSFECKLLVARNLIETPSRSGFPFSFNVSPSTASIAYRNTLSKGSSGNTSSSCRVLRFFCDSLRCSYVIPFRLFCMARISFGDTKSGFWNNVWPPNDPRKIRIGFNTNRGPISTREVFSSWPNCFLAKCASNAFVGCCSKIW